MRNRELDFFYFEEKGYLHYFPYFRCLKSQEKGIQWKENNPRVSNVALDIVVRIVIVETQLKAAGQKQENNDIIAIIEEKDLSHFIPIKRIDRI